MQTSLNDQQAYIGRLMKTAKGEDYIILNDIASSLAAIRFGFRAFEKEEENKKQKQNGKKV